MDIVSSIGLKYFTNRKSYPISSKKWLDSKKIDDNLNGLWRIHDDLYDLTTFIDKHPGGSQWLELTKGTDITEAFETHHIEGVPKQILSKYFIKKAVKPRISPFTFHPNGFYNTLKTRIAKELPEIPRTVIYRSKIIADSLLLSYLITSFLAMFLQNYLLAAFAGYLLTVVVNVSHNFVHQKNNVRMFYMDFSMLSSRSFRVSHSLSHHLFPNTIHDLEVSMYEPFIHFLPVKKSKLTKFCSWFCALLVYPFMFLISYTTRLLEHELVMADALPWTVLLLGHLSTGQTFLNSLKVFITIILCSSFFFNLIGTTAAHHHPEIFHDGDAPRPKTELDFGVYQLDAVADRPNITGSPFLVLTNFGDHALHHLFPTLDHGVLDHLYPTFLKTCIEFGVDWKEYNSIDLLQGAVQQLIRTPNPNPPPPLKMKHLQ